MEVGSQEPGVGIAPSPRPGLSSPRFKTSRHVMRAPIRTNCRLWSTIRCGRFAHNGVPKPWPTKP